ncbi:MAG: M28 family peptidase [Candidatus Thorarchaeota archaeon]
MRRLLLVLFVLSMISTTTPVYKISNQFSQSTGILAQTSQNIERVYGANFAEEIFYACNYDTFRSYVQSLSEIGSRFSRETESNDAARDWIVSQLTEVSDGRVEVSLVGNYDNVIGILPGYLPGDNPVFVLSAHYDTNEGSPGANDDGSGVALLIELARVLSQYDWPLDIYFCAFNAAIAIEFGTPFQGSNEVAEEASALGIDIIALYNIDSILYRNYYAYADEQVLMAYAEGFEYHVAKYWADLAEMMGNLYGFDITSSVSSGDFPLWSSSDHISFYQEGYRSVICAYESSWDQDSISGGPGDYYSYSRFNYHLGRATAGVIGGCIAFSMSREYGEPVRHEINGIINGGFNRTLPLAITTPTRINAASRWWGGGAQFKVYNSMWNLVDINIYPDASAWESQQVLSTQITIPGLYYVVVDCLANYSLGYEIKVEYEADVDGNGVLDRNEYWLDSALFHMDSDQDSLSDAMEIIVGTDSSSPDSDLDSISDGWEYEYGLDPLDPSDAQDDADSDGVSNADEFLNNLNPNSADSDMDLIPDLYELENGLNPLVNDAELDPDGDGKNNLNEYLDGSNPQVADQDFFDFMVIAIPSGAFLLFGVGAYLSKKYSNLMES